MTAPAPRAAKNCITQSELKELLHYDPETGAFTWLKYRNYNARIGDVAGHLDKSCGYIDIWADNKSYQAQRLAWFYMTGEWPNKIDHKDHIRHNNIWDNLRDATNQENSRNTKLYKTNKSGVVGVCWHKRDANWYSYIMVNLKQIYLGNYIDKFEAICARMSANNKYGFHENHGR